MSRIHDALPSPVRHTARLCVTTVLVASAFSLPTAQAQTGTPKATLIAAAPLDLGGAADSNSPAVWETVEGRQILHVLTSVDGTPSLSRGFGHQRLSPAMPVGFTSHPGHGVWMEAVVPDVDGTWYGFYHNEIPAEICGRPDRTVPRIGAARSTDRGRSWTDLGIILEAPDAGLVCDSPNGYFLGGVGDFSVVVDQDAAYLYLFFSQYSHGAAGQGVSVARMPWASRDTPVGALAVWSDGVWLPARAAGMAGETSADTAGDTPALRWEHATGTPLTAPAQPWHDADPRVDAFWGPSVHWNAAIQRYVMLLNRAGDEAWTQEGVYVAYATRLDDPTTWTAPERLFEGGKWYPQVLGLERGTGTDKEAGAVARFYMGGASNYLITFTLVPAP